MVWGVGVAVMWHYGIVQPFLKQILVYMYILLGILLLLIIVAVQVYLRLWGTLDQGLEVIDFIHDKVDDLMVVLHLQPKRSKGGEKADAGKDGAQDDEDKEEDADFPPPRERRLASH